MRPAVYLYTRKRKVRWQFSDSNTTGRCAPNTRASLGGVTSLSGATLEHLRNQAAGVWYQDIGVSVGYKPVIWSKAGQVPMYNSLQVGVSVRY